MKGFGRWVVKYRQLILIICLLLLIPGFYGMAKSKINYDILTYLPKDLNSAQGQDILEKDFHIAANAFVLVQDDNDWEVQQLKKRIARVDGVEKVTWIDNWADITIPDEFVPQQVRDQFFRGHSTLLQVQFKEGSGSDRTVAAVNDIKGILDQNMYLGGTSAVIADLRVLIDHERILYLIVAVLLIILILSLTLSSTIVPILFLISIGTAVVYNLGTNTFLGSISYVTSAIAAVLQLGVTMDFSIFLMHRYLEEKQKQETREEAMAEAINRTFVAIGASSLTAIAGFLSLGVMQIGLGKDMGVVMAKGVALGVIISLTMLPALILRFDDVITRLQHRTLMPGFKWTARLVSKRYWVLVVLFVLLLFPAYYGKEHVKVFYNVADMLPRDMDSIKGTDTVKQCFGLSDTLYLITPANQKWQLKELTARIKDMPGVVRVVSPTDAMDVAVPDQYVSPAIRDQFTRGKYCYTVIQSKYPPADPQSHRLVQDLRKAAAETCGEYYLSGESALTDDMIKLVGTDQKAVDKWSVGAILLILAFTFWSLSLPILLVMVIELAILINFAIPFYSGVTIPFIALLVIGAVQLGSCVNYAILVVSRYKEELLAHDKFTAAANAVKGSAPSVVTSALTLCFATIGVGFISKITMIGVITKMIARGAIISMFSILFFLPALLIVCQTIIEYTSLRWNKGLSTEGGTASERAVQA